MRAEGVEGPAPYTASMAQGPSPEDKERERGGCGGEGAARNRTIGKDGRPVAEVLTKGTNGHGAAKELK